MLEEELFVLAMLMEMMRRQHDREDRHFSLQLDRHDAVDDRFGDEVMTVDSTVDHKPCRDDDRIAAGFCEQFGLEWNFKAAGDVDGIHGLRFDAQFIQRIGERKVGLIDDVLVPTGADKGDPMRAAGR